MASFIMPAPKQTDNCDASVIDELDALELPSDGMPSIPVPAFADLIDDDDENEGPDPGLPIYQGQSPIRRVLAVEKATDYEGDDRCPSCEDVVKHVLVILLQNGDVCRACCECVCLDWDA